MSRKYPTWIKQQIEKVATHLITKSNYVDDVISVVKPAFEDLDYGRLEAKDMQFTEQIDKNPNQYPNDKDIRIKVLGLELDAGKGELVYWYESLANKRGYSTKIKDLSIKKYKEILWNKIEDMLEVVGYDIAKIKQDLLYEIESSMIITVITENDDSLYTCYNLTTNKTFPLVKDIEYLVSLITLNY
jgi:hypothetical protein